jgi:hypothetical protein
MKKLEKALWPGKALETGQVTTQLGRQCQPFPCTCRRQQRHPRQATRGMHQGRELVLTVWRQGIGGEMPSVRRRIDLELVFYCVGIHCGIVYDCYSILFVTPW